MVMSNSMFVLVLCFFLPNLTVCSETAGFLQGNSIEDVTVDILELIAKEIVPPLQHGKAKGEAGKIGVIGGSIEYTGAPYFAAMSALKSGADLVYVVTTESAAPVIKSYSPDLIVYPYLNIKSASKINALIPKMDVVVIGPGLGREYEALTLTEDIIKTCKSLAKPLVIDADGLYAVSKNPIIIKDYPSPGVIMTPNLREANKLQEAVTGNDTIKWFTFWGDNISVLVKGQADQFYSSTSTYNWASSQGGTGRRAAGQGDILSGSLGTTFHWAIKYNNYPEYYRHDRIAQSVAAYSSAKFTRICNSKAFNLFGRSMTASDMLGRIHEAFEEIF